MEKIFVAVESCTENCIGSVGYITTIDAYKTKEKAYDMIRKEHTGSDDPFTIYERMLLKADGSKVLEATCNYSDFEGNEIRWKVREINLP
jgi:hypothetical protein